MTKRRLALIAVFVFFFGFPLAGILYVYGKAHSVMRESALAFAQEDVTKILQNTDSEELRFLGTIEFKSEFDKEGFERAMTAQGAYEGHGPFKVTRSTVGQRGDFAWQLVDLKAPVKFARGESELRLRVGRRSTVLSEWRIESFSLDRPDME